MLKLCKVTLLQAAGDFMHKYLMNFMELSDESVNFIEESLIAQWFIIVDKVCTCAYVSLFYFYCTIIFNCFNHNKLNHLHIIIVCRYIF